MDFSQVTSFTKKSIIDWADKHLCNGSKDITDVILGFEGLDDVGFSHKVIITEDAPESVKIGDFKWVNTVIANVKRSFHGTFHAISKKHFGRHLGEFFYRFNRRFNLQQLIPRFIYVVLKTPPMPQKLIKVAELSGQSE
jgi:hypothetical protein